jgi:hypothetical protein
VIADPPLFAGAEYVTVAVVLLVKAVAVPIVGAQGTDTGAVELLEVLVEY